MGRYLCVLAGGAVGSLTRYLLGRAIVQRFPNSQFALGTFFINVTGSFLIGLLMTLIVERLRLPHYWQLTLVVGLLGGYTTFSSFEYDAYLSTRSGHHWLTLAYLVGSVVFGYAAVWLGVLAAGRR
ncbi:MAG: camphor resistance protein CrcB [Bryobacterales bacterium]|jgi:fluoride exporter|nr:camphor resistance protein CrcB [Bryobacterales bacterium]